MVHWVKISLYFELRSKVSYKLGCSLEVLGKIVFRYFENCLFCSFKKVSDKEVLNWWCFFKEPEHIDSLLFTLFKSLGVFVAKGLVRANHVLVMEQVVKLGEELFLLEKHAGWFVDAVACDFHYVDQSVAANRLVNNLIKVVNLLKRFDTLLPAFSLVAHFFTIEIRTEFIEVLACLILLINELICTIVGNLLRLKEHLGEVGNVIRNLVGKQVVLSVLNFLFSNGGHESHAIFHIS